MTLAIGDKIKANDPRMPNRTLVVTEFTDLETSRPTTPEAATHVWAQTEMGWGRTRIALKFIHTDDKPRRTGWSMVRDNPPT
jgi:hypothetical protein